jgi:pimeloyl-ACP methyl ester carboxylesterase
MDWTSETVSIAGSAMHLARAGSGPPLVMLQHDTGTPEGLPFYDALARDFTVLRPAHLGYDKSERPAWMRNVRDMAVVYQTLLAQHPATRDRRDVSVVGLGFGGWIAAEMATMAPAALRRLVLVGAMGIKPERGEIADQALVSYIDYVRLGFAREMTFRIAWKPYMYNPSLPHLLGGVATPTLVVWGREDRVVPLECGERYAKALPQARLSIVEGAGHYVEMEQPEELATLARAFVTAA